MKIEISFQLSKDKKAGITVPDFLVDKFISAIDEMLYRVYEYENGKNDELYYKNKEDIIFPLYPFSISKIKKFKDRKVFEVEKMDNTYVKPWSSTTPEDCISERKLIIESLANAGVIWLLEPIKKNKVRFKINNELLRRIKTIAIREKNNFLNTNGAKRKLFISSTKGIYLEDSDKAYQIENPSKRLEIIKTLKQRPATAKVLSFQTNRKEKMIIQEIIKINNVFKKELSIINDLITHNNTSGYALNEEDFEIKFIR